MGGGWQLTHTYTVTSISTSNCEGGGTKAEFDCGHLPHMIEWKRANGQVGEKPWQQAHTIWSQAGQLLMGPCASQGVGWWLGRGSCDPFSAVVPPSCTGPRETVAVSLHTIWSRAGVQLEKRCCVPSSTNVTLLSGREGGDVTGPHCPLSPKVLYTALPYRGGGLVRLFQLRKPKNQFSF